MIIKLQASRLLITALFALGIALPAAAQTPGVTPNSILLGQSAAFSGPAAQLGIEMNAGAVAYFDYINKQGGVHGRTISVKTRDDRYEGNLAAENTHKLIEEDKVFALFAYVGTPTSAAASPTRCRMPNDSSRHGRSMIFESPSASSTASAAARSAPRASATNPTCSTTVKNS